MTRAILRVLVLAGVTFVAFTAGAQEAAPPAEPMAGTPWDVFGGIFGVLATLVVGGLGWLSTKLNAYLSTKHKDAVWAGMVARLNTALMDSVRGRVATLKASFADAKDPASPGGERITKSELEGIKNDVWEDLKKQYGGVEGLKKGLGVLAGDDVEHWVKNKIGGAVAAVENEERAAAASGTANPQ